MGRGKRVGEGEERDGWRRKMEEVLAGKTKR